MKKKSIIEKLGITPWPWGITVDDGYHISYYSKEAKCRPIHAETWSRENAQIISAAPEMLEALIQFANEIDQKGGDGMTLAEELKFTFLSGIIEKATGKSFEEIKELL